MELEVLTVDSSESSAAVAGVAKDAGATTAGFTSFTCIALRRGKVDETVAAVGAITDIDAEFVFNGLVATASVPTGAFDSVANAGVVERSSATLRQPPDEALVARGAAGDVGGEVTLPGEAGTADVRGPTFG